MVSGTLDSYLCYFFFMFLKDGGKTRYPKEWSWSHRVEGKAAFIFSHSLLSFFFFFFWFPLLHKSLSIWIGPVGLFSFLFLLSWETHQKGIFSFLSHSQVFKEGGWHPSVHAPAPPPHGAYYETPGTLYLTPLVSPPTPGSSQNDL